MEIQNIDGIAPAIGPYCHAVRTGNLLFCSGQIPLCPDTKTIVKGGIAEQTERVLTNIDSLLRGMGLALSDVVKTTVFLKEMADFAGMNAVYARWFGAHTPARSTISVKALPLDALVEIECLVEVS